MRVCLVFVRESLKGKTWCNHIGVTVQIGLPSRFALLVVVSVKGAGLNVALTRLYSGVALDCGSPFYPGRVERKHYAV